MKDYQKKYIKDSFLEVRKKLNLCYSYLTEMENYIIEADSEAELIDE